MFKMSRIMEVHRKQKTFRVIKPNINTCKYGMPFIKHTHLFGWAPTGPP